MFQNLGLQLFTIRDYMKDPEFADLSFARLAKLGYTEAQAAGCEFDPKLFGELLQKHGIKVVGNHCGLDDILKTPEKTMEIHRMWGTTNLGIGGIPHEARQGGEALRKFIKDYNKAAEDFAKEGFKLTFHNHNYELEQIDGTKTLLTCSRRSSTPKTSPSCWTPAGWLQAAVTFATGSKSWRDASTFCTSRISPSSPTSRNSPQP